MVYILFPFSIYSNLVSITTIAIWRSLESGRQVVVAVGMPFVFADGQHAISCFMRSSFPGTKGVWQHFFVIVLTIAYSSGELFAHTICLLAL